jgi:hypothetical protein
MQRANVSGELPIIDSRAPVAHEHHKHNVVEDADDSTWKGSSLHTRCKYRKSCYETGSHQCTRTILKRDKGELPDLSDEQVDHKHVTEKEEHVDLGEMKELQKKLYCKYRHSCYETGERANLQTVAAVHKEHSAVYEHDHVDHVVNMKVECKYRKTCYDKR